MISSHTHVGLITLATCCLLPGGALADGWIKSPVNNHYYRLTDQNSNWTDAQIEAEACGGNLVTINDQPENDWILATFGQQSNRWIGFYQDLKDQENYSEPSGAWKWISGDQVTFTNWISTEPNDNGDEHWAQIKGKLSTWAGEWNDHSLIETLRGVIEIVPGEGGWVDWPITEGGNGHLYRLTDAPGTWPVSEFEAVSCGAHLATIRDAAENQWVLETFGSSTNLWIGLYQDLDHPSYREPAGGWFWINGEPVPYINWISGEPNDNGDEHWVQMKGQQSTWAGQWNDHSLIEMLHGVIEVPGCPWDLDGSGDVGIEDFLSLLSLWGTDPGGPPDFDFDGTVGITDFLDLLANWGPCA